MQADGADFRLSADVFADPSGGVVEDGDVDGDELGLLGEGGGEREAAKLGVPLLGKVPLDIRTRTCGDEGHPVALDDPGQSRVSAAFRGVASTLSSVLGE